MDPARSSPPAAAAGGRDSPAPGSAARSRPGRADSGGRGAASSTSSTSSGGIRSPPSSPEEQAPPGPAVNGSAVHSPPANHAAPPRTKEARAAVAEAVNGSPVRSPPSSAPAVVPRVSSLRDDAAAGGSPVRSRSRSSGNLGESRAEAWAVVPAVSSLRDEAVTGSPARSPRREAVAARLEKENSFSSASSYRSPHHDAANPASSPALSPLHMGTVYGSPMRKGAITVGAILCSPGLAPEDPSLEKVTSPMVPVANRMVSNETTLKSTVGEREGGARESMMMVESRISQITLLSMTTVVLRLLAFLFSMISFSVMAADKTSGWDGDSFDRYTEFRYCLSMNVIVFVYSLFQLCVHGHQKMQKTRVMNRPNTYYLSFFMDQALAYLLMSASSSAASRNDDWVADFGSDAFTKKISGSVAVSFLAFLALALSSIISAYKFFTWNL